MFPQLLDQFFVIKNYIVVQVSWSRYCWKNYPSGCKASELIGKMNLITGLSVDRVYRLTRSTELSWLLIIMLFNLNYRNGVNINVPQSRLPALVCSPQLEYGCHQARSQGDNGSISPQFQIFCLIRHTIRPVLAGIVAVFKALSRRPGQSTKKPRIGIQSAIMHVVW